MVIERHEIGAHWTGQYHYTDGLQCLVTPPEHDIGFPYKSRSFFSAQADIDSEMHTLSWSAYLADSKQSVDWLHRLDKYPTHKEFVKYLKWVHDRSEFPLKIANVDKISVADGNWRL